jgi:hypothetical protein
MGGRERKNEENRLGLGVGADADARRGKSTSCLCLQELWTKLVINFSIFFFLPLSSLWFFFHFQFTVSDISLQLRLMPISVQMCLFEEA